MFALNLLFFVSLAIGSTLLAWVSHADPIRRTLWRFAFVSGASWLLAALLLLGGMSVFTPSEPAAHLPTLVVATFVPAVAIAFAVGFVRNRWSRVGKALLALSLSAGFGLLALMFILIATCAVQSNCL
jgi:hypothetical protein